MDNCGLSVRSATTRGGVEFDDLVTERVDPSYTFRLMRIKSTCKQVECAPTHSRMDPEHTATTTMGDLCSVSSLSTQLLAFVNINCSHSSCLYPIDTTAVSCTISGHAPAVFPGWLPSCTKILPTVCLLPSR